jgi:hypothetical protein
MTLFKGNGKEATATAKWIPAFAGMTSKSKSAWHSDETDPSFPVVYGKDKCLLFPLGASAPPPTLPGYGRLSFSAIIPPLMAP